MKAVNQLVRYLRATGGLSDEDYNRLIEGGYADPGMDWWVNALHNDTHNDELRGRFADYLKRVGHPFADIVRAERPYVYVQKSKAEPLTGRKTQGQTTIHNRAATDRVYFTLHGPTVEGKEGGQSRLVWAYKSKNAKLDAERAEKANQEGVYG